MILLFELNLTNILLKKLKNIYIYIIVEEKLYFFLFV